MEYVVGVVALSVSCPVFEAREVFFFKKKFFFFFKGRWQRESYRRRLVLAEVWYNLQKLHVHNLLGLHTSATHWSVLGPPNWKYIPRGIAYTATCRHYQRAQSQGHHTIDCLEERGVERGSARRSSLKGRERAIINPTNIGTVSKATLGKLPRDGVERIWTFPSA